MTDESETDRNAEEEFPKSGSILAPAPLLFLPALLLGVVIGRIEGREPDRWPWNVLVGGPLLLAGSALFASSILAMRSVNKSPSHADEPPELLTNGPFQYSRNPIYTGLIGVYVGTTLLVDGSWPLFTLLPVLGYLDRVVDEEEAFLEARFGTEFDRYRRRVPRWL